MKTKQYIEDRSNSYKERKSKFKGSEVLFLQLELEDIEAFVNNKDKVEGQVILHAVEFGYTQCEKGNNIQMALLNYNQIFNPN